MLYLLFYVIHFLFFIGLLLLFGYLYRSKTIKRGQLKTAVILSILAPGAGQFYNREAKLGLIISCLYVLFLIDLLSPFAQIILIVSVLLSVNTVRAHQKKMREINKQRQTIFKLKKQISERKDAIREGVIQAIS